MSWRRIKHPSEVITEGDVVNVIVLSVDREKEKVSLKLSEVHENPWHTMTERYEIGDVVSGRVTKLMNFGAFVEIEEGIEGLIHISELAEQHVNRPSEIVQIGDVVNVMILDMDGEQQKLSLSLKAASDMDDVAVLDILDEQESSNTTLSDLFGDKLKNLKF
jgi:small subunit ribosomal protein S1